MTYHFRQPVTVLRYLPLEQQWGKAAYRALPSRLPQWPEKVLLQNGCILNGQLLLRYDLKDSLAKGETGTLFLSGQQEAAWSNVAVCPHKLPHFLQLHLQGNDIWVAVRDDYYPLFGSKGRERFDVLPLLPGKSAAVHINARYWHSLAGFGRDSTYVENYLYLENLGQFEEATLVKGLEESFVLQPQKDVDLRQMLY